MSTSFYYLLQFLLGGVSVVGVTLVAKYLDPKYTGIVYALPVILIVASIFVYLGQGIDVTQRTLRSTFVYEFTLVFFAFAFYSLLSRTNFWVALFVAFVGWVLVSLLIQVLFKSWL